MHRAGTKAFGRHCLWRDGRPFVSGLAVADELRQRGGAVTLMISPRDVDQQAMKYSPAWDFHPACHGSAKPGLVFPFAARPLEVLASPGTFQESSAPAVWPWAALHSAPPIIAARSSAAKTFLHESNTIPGRANRFLSGFVDEAFVGFSGAAARLKTRRETTVTGTPVRPQFFIPENPADVRSKSASCRAALGLEPDRPTILVVGGSQGASGLNEMILSALPLLAGKNWQWLHLTGANDVEKVKSAYAARGIPAVVKPFLAEMDLALGAATACVSRSGASSLTEIAATRLPSLLVPFPAAADNHQFFNAAAFEKTGAAKLLEQKNSTPEKVAALLTGLVESDDARSKMRRP